ncbi:MAG: acetyl-CoA carboxylase biotin carboxylase subunit [Cyclobacteriaceae bacterium]
MEIKKILVANRGEIALRVMRSASEMGIKTVAVYSEADKNAPFVAFADEAVLIGPPPSSESYLKGEKIIEVAKNLKVDAIHPGYGFLSENAGFAKAVNESGLIFIGPSPEAIETMGDKLKAKEAVGKYDIPLVPGTEGAVSDPEEAKKVADEIGYPVLIKASAGGGGKGMRIVHSADEIVEQMERAVSEAKSAFGDGSVFIEKYITSPKHIEVQVIGDQHGNIVHLFERDCSIQRRHQKVIEEAPSPVMDTKQRMQIGETAVNVAKACNYFGAGTVEFVVDKDLNYYFLEMNTRLQVEHPVTELVTGVDLVKEQIAVAEGKTLPFSQNDLELHGHAIEVRVYAEDPANNFLPDVGQLTTYKRPMGPGIRVDDGFEEGMEIPIYYDPMIAKLITYGKDRTEAIARMRRAIEEYQITGVQTTLAFCHFVLGHDDFISGKFSTKFVEQYFKPETIASELTEQEQSIAAAIALHHFTTENKMADISDSANPSRSNRRWKQRLKN